MAEAQVRDDVDESIEEGRELTPFEADASVAAVIDKGQLDVAITTAHKFPRSVKKFRNEVLYLATLNEETARECFYTLERKDRKTGKTKLIVGPSVRFAEILGSCWGNARVGARIVDVGDEFVTAEGLFFDLEKNWTVGRRVDRRITDSNGRKYGADMIGVTGNAASSIALRNAILAAVPKAFWRDLWDKTREVALGKAKTHEARREAIFARLKERGVEEERALKRLGRASIDDVTPDDLLIIFGLMERVNGGDETVDEVFAVSDEASSSTVSPTIDKINKDMRASPGAGPKPAPSHGPTDIEVAAKINTAKTVDELAEAEDLARGFAEPKKTHLLDLAKARRIELNG